MQICIILTTKTKLSSWIRIFSEYHSIWCKARDGKYDKAIIKFHGKSISTEVVKSWEENAKVNDIEKNSV